MKKNKKRVGFYCEEEIYEKIKNLSEEKDISVSKLIEKSLRNFYEQNDSKKQITEKEEQKVMNKKTYSDEDIKYEIGYQYKDNEFQLMVASIETMIHSINIQWNNESQEFQVLLMPFTVMYDNYTLENTSKLKTSSEVSEYLYGLDTETEIALSNYKEISSYAITCLNKINKTIEELKQGEF